MKPIIFRREARADVLDVHAWYEAKIEGLGEEFRAELRVAIGRLQQRPAAYPCVHQDIRRARLRRFPYGVFYREYEQAIVVVAVLHARRHPKQWKRRP